MKILLVTPTLPVPNSGGNTRVYNLIKYIATHHQVTVLSFIKPAEQEWLPLLQPLCANLELIPFSGFPVASKWRNRLLGWRQILFSQRPRYVHTFPVEAMRPSLQKLLAQYDFDLVIFETLYLVELVNEVDGTPILLGQQNVESDIQKRAYEIAANPIHRWRDKLMWRKLYQFEKRYVQQFSACLAVSERDAALMCQMSPQTEVHIVPNGVDCLHFQPQPATEREENKLLFFGTLNYGPNVEGLLWFVQEIWTHISTKRPKVILEIMGINPVQEIVALAQHSSIHLVGFVPDVREKLWTTTICVVPLLTGGGTRLKILEALAAGCPVVSTTVGAEGLDLEDGRHLLLGDTAEEFAAQVLTLLDSPAQRHSLGQEGQQAVVRQYDWATIGQQFEAALVNTVAQWQERAGQ